MPKKITDAASCSSDEPRLIWKTGHLKFGINYKPKFALQLKKMAMLYDKETYEIIGIAMEIHRVLGHGFSEIFYKDALEIEFQSKNIEYSREKEYAISYKGRTLRHKFYADFIVFDKIILEAKGVNSSFNNNDMKQSINYLKASGCRIGLLINFGQTKLLHQRLIF